MDISSIVDWAVKHSLDVIVILVIAIAIQYVARRFITSIVRRSIKHSRGSHSTIEAEQKREDTLISILIGLIVAVIWVTAGIMILSSFGIEIAPILATAGIAGVALGFGSQYLIKDLIAGLFIIIENQYQVGDVVTMGTTSGFVEDISLRMTTLRDLDGVVHHIPNGNVTIISNMTKEISRVNLNIGVSYSSDIEHVIKVIDKVGKDMANADEWKHQIIEAPHFLRIDDFSDSAITIKIVGETKPAKQWDVTGELRKRLKIAFDKEKIEIPFPQRVVHMAKD